MPSTTPIAPPTSGQGDGLHQELRRGCPARAPIAMRMPISRVRSVTDTSMMFMIPMPPTRSETRRDAGEQRREHPRDGLEQRLRARAGRGPRSCPRHLCGCSAGAEDLRDLLLGVLMRSGDFADAMKTCTRSLPMIRRENVAYGMKTTSSWLLEGRARPSTPSRRPRGRPAGARASPGRWRSGPGTSRRPRSGRSRRRVEACRSSSWLRRRPGRRPRPGSRSTPASRRTWSPSGSAGRRRRG